MNALQAVGSEQSAVTYIYCNYSEAEKQNPENLLRSILLQLVSHKHVIMDELTEAYKKHSKEGTTPSLHECCRLVHAAIGCFSKTYLVIDALDECAEGTMNILFAELRKMRPPISILITSRHIVTNHYDPTSALRLGIEADVVDIRQYLEERIKDSTALQAYFKNDTDLRDVIISGVADKAKGM